MDLASGAGWATSVVRRSVGGKAHPMKHFRNTPKSALINKSLTNPGEKKMIGLLLISSAYSAIVPTFALGNVGDELLLVWVWGCWR